MFQKDKPAPPVVPRMCFGGELEAKKSFDSKLCPSFKVAWDNKAIPTFNGTCLYSLEHAFAGLNYTYDHKASHKLGFLEMMMGVVCEKALTAYVKL